MTINELRIQLDLQPENKINILKDAAIKCNEGYIFVDSVDGYCYLFNEDGNEDDIKKIKNIGGDWAFAHCGSLKLIKISNSIERIGNYAFIGCINLESIIIPDSVKHIGYYAFEGCKNLKPIVIPDSIESIGNWAFGYCRSLESIEIPDSIESIGNFAFLGCKKLKSLIFKGKTIYQIKAMDNYPFGITDESIIRCI